METPYKPAGYHSLSPYLVVNGPQKPAPLLQLFFETRELRRYEKPEGKIVPLELRIDDSVLMPADSKPVRK